MSIFRSVLVCCLISLSMAIVLFFLGSLAGYEQFKGGYAVLSVDASVEDRIVRDRLDSGRALFGGMPVSESSSWVILDVFGSFEQVPLDKYDSRVLSFDPRNDGYAARLREFFIRDNKRYIYVPLLAGNWKDTFLDRHFSNIMQDIPFSIDYYGIGMPLSLFFISYGAASLVLFFLCYIKKNIQLWTVNILTLIPLFSALAFFGAEGIAASSILFGAFFLLREPLYEIASMPGLFKGALKKKFYKEIYQPYKLYWDSMIFFAGALVILVVFTQLKLLFLIVIFLASLAVFFISSNILSKDIGSRRRFSPVAIFKKTVSEFAFSVYMLPFIIAAFAVFLITPFFPGSYDAGRKFEAAINEQDYYDHLSYQASFSTRQLNTGDTGYFDFYFDEDGLPAASGEQNHHNINLGNFPPFPLKHLIDFLNNVNNDTTENMPNSGGTLKEKLALLVLLLFIIPGIFFKKDRINNIYGRIKIIKIRKVKYVSNVNKDQIRRDA